MNVTVPFGVPFSAVTFEATSTDVPAGTVTVVGVSPCQPAGSVAFKVTVSGAVPALAICKGMRTAPAH